MSYVATRRRGMSGSGAAAIQGVQIGTSLGAPIATTVAAPAVGTALGISTALAVPVIGAAVAGVGLLIAHLIANSGCGPTCIQTSAWANQAEPLLKKNADAYFATSPRYQSTKDAALASFDAIWNQLQNLCSQPNVGNAGKRCIEDRQAGACKWKATADSPWPGGPKQGECWNWFNAYRDVIANDPVAPDSVVSQLGAAVSSSGVPLWGWLGLGALVLWGVTQN